MFPPLLVPLLCSGEPAYNSSSPLGYYVAKKKKNGQDKPSHNVTVRSLQECFDDPILKEWGRSALVVEFRFSVWVRAGTVALSSLSWLVLVLILVLFIKAQACTKSTHKNHLQLNFLPATVQFNLSHPHDPHLYSPPDSGVALDTVASAMSEAPLDSPDYEVFSDTPLGDYFRDQGDFLPVGPGSYIRAKQCLPLELEKSGSLKLQRIRFLSLIREALRSKLNDGENGQFLEKFRYCLVSSQLLEAGPRYRALANTDNKKILSSYKARVLFGDEPWKLLKVSKKFWVGSSGGCLLAVIGVLIEFYKSGKMTTKKSIIVFVVCLCTILYLFAHSRRKALRYVRAKAILQAQLFVNNNYRFDQAAGRLLGLVQEVELLARGYRPDLADRVDLKQNYVPYSRLEQGGTTLRTAKNLRSALCASFFLVIQAYEDSLVKILPYVDRDSLSRYFDIYELSSRQEEVGLSIEGNSVVWQDSYNKSRSEYYGPSAANASLSRLRLEFRRVHCLRRSFLCCLLVINTSGVCSDEEFTEWFHVVDELDKTGGLMGHMAGALSRDNLLYSTAVPLDDITTGEETLVTPHMSLLLGTMHHLESRIQLLREDIDYEHNYHLLGEDIKSFLDIWQSGNMASGSQQDNARTNKRQSWLSTSTLVPPEESYGIISGNTSLDGYDEPMSPRESMREYQQNGVFEAISSGKERPRSTLTREERIALVKESRERETAKLRQAESQGNFLNELGNVLNNRRQP